jgi:hypothetical protein
LTHRENEEVVLRAEEKGRALARIAVDMKESVPAGSGKFFAGLAAAADTWSCLPVPVNTPYYAVVQAAYRDEIERLLGLSSPPP